MSAKSWSVTLTPLILAILQLVRIVAENRVPTDNEALVIVGAFIAFIGSAYAGAKVATKKT